MAVVATAGHVDHGKSTLVRLLTGQEPDRWAEERRRGLTIDLGYAWTDIDGRRVSLVDVPGHEHFAGNMLAGLGPVAAVMFVVGADDGWSAQSQEHARAVAALGIEHVLLVVTRCDLVPGEAARLESMEQLGSLDVPVAESVLVSGATGAGIPELRAALGRLAAAATPAGGADEPVRLWVDRTFSLRGAGTVATGTLALGRIAVGDELLVDGVPVGVRGLQTCGQDVGAVVGPVRVAVNLRGVAVRELGRGTALLGAGWPVRSVAVADVSLRRLQQSSVVGAPAEPLRLPRQLMLHVGTAAVAVRTQLLADGLVRLRLATPLPLRVGDRAVLRDPGRHEVLAGVDLRVVDPAVRRPQARTGARPEARPRESPTSRSLATHPGGLAAAYPGRTAALVAWLGEHPVQAPTREQLAAWGLTPRELAEAAQRGEVLRLGGVVVAPDAVARAESAVRTLTAPFSVGDAARALGASRRVAVPLLERLDAALVTRRLPDGSRELRDVTP
jgi:selenocysteine-specific elongation factor